MKCPNCGQWNRATLPRCVRCGTELTSDGPIGPSWRSELIADKSKEYIRVDEDGDIAVTPDDREVLAAEMEELKARKDAGILRQQQMMQESSRHRRSTPQVTLPPEQSPPEEDPFYAVDESIRAAAEAASAPARRRVRVHRTEQEDNTEAQSAQQAQKAYDPHRAYAPGQWQDSRNYDPLVDALQQNAFFQNPETIGQTHAYPRRHRFGLRTVIRFLSIVLVVGVLGLAGYVGIAAYRQFLDANSEKNRATVTASILDELAAHTILIPGEEGQSIYIKELHSSYIVTGGFATIEIADYTWYSDLATITDETMTVTLTPYVKTASGRQKPLDVISYDINIPLSPIKLLTPESLRTEVTTAMYSILFNVRPDSIVMINGENVSDAVNEKGELTYNATVQPIGDNVYNVSVRSPYCRDNSMQVVLYREVQEIPLDLAATTYTSTSLQVLPISATTLPGAEVDVLSPHSDLKITNLGTTGEFTFNAIFDKIGYNTISIEASYEGKKTSHVDYNIYYLPNPDVYTPKAWPLNKPDDYAELLGNINYRAANTQVYVAVGKIDHFVSEDPQMAVVYCSDDGLSQPVLLENQTKTVWKKGEYYNIYADAYGTYSGMPWLIARYTYK